MNIHTPQLQRLEAEALRIIRESAAEFRNPVLLNTSSASAGELADRVIRYLRSQHFIP